MSALRVGVEKVGVRVATSATEMGDAVRRVLKAEKVTDAMISVTLVTPAAMARLNRKHLGHAGATDVISFGFSPMPGGAVIGDIYICPAVAAANARVAKCPVREELLRLVVHGSLHVLGWDHPVDADRTRSPMWKRQERLLASVLKSARKPARA